MPVKNHLPRATVKRIISLIDLGIDDEDIAHAASVELEDVAWRRHASEMAFNPEREDGGMGTKRRLVAAAIRSGYTNYVALMREHHPEREVPGKWDHLPGTDDILPGFGFGNRFS